MSANQEVVVEKEVYHPRVNEFTQKFIREMQEEKDRLGDGFPIMNTLVDEAIERIYTTGHIPGKEFYADVFKQKPLKITQKVFLPLKEFPFNFTGKILGPKGNTLRRLQQETQCRIVIKGRNSIRDSAKEEELRQSGDPKFAHFKKELYLEISAVAPPAESYARIAYALAEIRKYIIPDKNDEVSHEQFREMIKINPDMPKSSLGPKTYDYKHMSGSSTEYKYPKSSYRMHVEEALVYAPEPIHEESYEGYEYPRSYTRHQPVYDYNRAHKRSQPTMYATDLKRGRESPTTHTPYRQYGGYKKYE